MDEADKAAIAAALQALGELILNCIGCMCAMYELAFTVNIWWYLGIITMLHVLEETDAQWCPVKKNDKRWQESPKWCEELGEEIDPDAGFTVVPLTECPHVTELPAWEISMKARCSVCKEDEVWICGTCGEILCSRYKNQHMLAHAEEHNHSVGLSFSDLSFWCFKCNAYLDVYAIPELHPLYRAAHVAKFGDQPSLPSTAASSSGATGGAASSSGAWNPQLKDVAVCSHKLLHCAAFAIRWRWCSDFAGDFMWFQCARRINMSPAVLGSDPALKAWHRWMPSLMVSGASEEAGSPNVVSITSRDQRAWSLEGPIMSNRRWKIGSSHQTLFKVAGLRIVEPLVRLMYRVKKVAAWFPTQTQLCFLVNRAWKRRIWGWHSRSFYEISGSWRRWMQQLIELTEICESAMRTWREQVEIQQKDR